MAKFEFDATLVDPWKGDDTPQEYALRAWLAAPEELDLPTACAEAAFDREVYDALWAWAIGQPDLPDTAKLRLYEALVRRPPRRGKGATASRDARLQAIAGVLVRLYGLQLTRNPTSTNVCAASVLTDLPDTPSEATLANLLTNS